MNLLVIGLNYAPEPVGIGPYTAQMCEGLVRLGHRVSVVAGKPYYPAWRAYDGHRGPGWSRGVEHGVEIVRCPHYIPARPNGVRRILHHLSFALTSLPAVAWRALSRRPKIILCVAPSLFSVPVARLAAWLCGARLWVHVQDFEVESAFATGLVAERGLLARLARATEDRLLRLADRVSTISPQMLARLRAKGIAPERTRELRNWASVAAAHADPAAFRREWNLGDRRVALYSGNIANKQGIEVLIAAARHLAARDDLVFVICGEGPNRARIEAMAAEFGNIRFHDLQPAGRLGELLALADVHLLPQIAGAADLVLPSKLANIFASGRPVVATAAPGTGLAVEIEGAGIVVPPGDSAAIAAAIGALLDDPANAARLGSAGRERATSRWDRAAILDRLDRDLRALAEERQ